MKGVFLSMLAMAAVSIPMLGFTAYHLLAPLMGEEIVPPIICSTVIAEVITVVAGIATAISIADGD